MCEQGKCKIVGKKCFKTLVEFLLIDCFVRVNKDLLTSEKLETKFCLGL